MIPSLAANSSDGSTTNQNGNWNTSSQWNVRIVQETDSFWNKANTGFCFGSALVLRLLVAQNSFSGRMWSLFVPAREFCSSVWVRESCTVSGGEKTKQVVFVHQRNETMEKESTHIVYDGEWDWLKSVFEAEEESVGLMMLTKRVVSWGDTNLVNRRARRVSELGRDDMS